MPLTHVCMWSKNQWKRISIKQASKMHPLGSVSARSGLFMCELCGQYVTMTEANVRDSYFKHSLAEADKNCPERTFGAANWEATYNTLQLNTKGMPIKFQLYGNSFKLFIGFPALPEHLKDNSNTLTIHFGYGHKRKYSFERLDNNGITYLDVSNIISSNYKIELENNTAEISKYWQLSFKGINGDCLFDSSNGRKLSIDSDVKLNEKYYALAREHIVKFCDSISIKRITFIDNWNIYEIKALKYDENSAKFFLEYFRCRLTDAPISLTFVWPLSIETPYLMYHKQGKVFTYLKGNAAFKLFLFTYQSCQQLNDGKLLPISCNDRQQILAIGRTVNILDYTYLWEDELDYDVKYDILSVTDENGNEISSDKNPNLYSIKEIKFIPQYDGWFIVEENGWIVYKVSINSNEQFRFTDVKSDHIYKIYRGIDCIWSINTNSGKTRIDNSDVQNLINDDILLSKLKMCNGKKIKISHPYGYLARKMQEYPKTKTWLSIQIKKGYIPASAKKLIEIYFL